MGIGRGRTSPDNAANRIEASKSNEHELDPQSSFGDIPICSRCCTGAEWQHESFDENYRLVIMMGISMRETETTEKWIPAAGYFRMSSDDQTTSIKQQEKEVVDLEQRGGFRIVERYYEEGRSGSKDQDLRTEFNRMLLDAAVGKFKAILCYDSSRFARLDSIDGAIAKQMLRKHGVYLVT